MGFSIGHREGDESAIETALRELKEETGITEIELDERKYIERNRFVVMLNGLFTFISDMCKVAQ